MRFKSLVVIFLFVMLSVAAQDKKQTNNAIPNVVDSLYREDQLYIGLSFSLMTKKPANYNQNGFSGGLHAGFIRDMPINKRRNVAIGVGLGLSTNTYNSNLFIGKTPNGDGAYSILDNSIDVDRNRLNTNAIELPLQFRWRTSTPTEYSFWRVYSGIKFSYLYYYKSNFKNSEITSTQTDLPEINRLQYAATFSLGHGSFNAFLQYNLNTLFNEKALINNAPVNLQPIQFGIEFYIL
jgi:hypothetical protein